MFRVAETLVFSLAVLIGIALLIFKGAQPLTAIRFMIQAHELRPGVAALLLPSLLDFCLTLTGLVQGAAASRRRRGAATWEWIAIDDLTAPMALAV